MATGAELSYAANVNALTVVSSKLRDGHAVVGVSPNVANNSAAMGLYANGQLSASIAPSASGVILSSGDLWPFTRSSGEPNRLAFISGDTNGPQGDVMFNAIVGAQTSDGVAVLDVLANDHRSANASLTVTHRNGVPVTAGQMVSLPSGQTVTMNANGTLSITDDGQVEPRASTHDPGDTRGNTAMGIVAINQVPCSVAGTRLLNRQGVIACLFPEVAASPSGGFVQAARRIRQRYEAKVPLGALRRPAMQSAA